MSTADPVLEPATLELVADNVAQQERRESLTAPRTNRLRSLGTVFGLMCFLQTVVDPSDGLTMQPVRALLKSWQESPAQITAFAALLSLPWILKPLYGLLTDFVPLGGYRRKSYLIVNSAGVALGFLPLYALPPTREAYGFLFTSLLISTIGVAFANVVIDALIVERGESGGLTGRLQSVQWTAIYAASVLTGIAGGYLSSHAQYRLAFLLCGAGGLLTLSVAWLGVREPQTAAKVGGLVIGRRSLWSAVRSPVVLSVCLFCFLFEFNPCSTTVVYLHMTGDLRFSEEFYGLTRSIVAVASIVACIGFGVFSDRLPLRKLLQLSIGLGIASTLVYLALDGPVSACVVSFLFGLAYMTAMLIQVHLAARACPAAAAGTVFALVLALSNFGSSLATWIGGHLYEQGIAWWGHRAAFEALVIVGAACTALCWLVLPFLPASLIHSHTPGDLACPIPIPTSPR
jgi:MFS family permease